MNKEIDNIVNNHLDLFGISPKIEKINIGFTNTIYSVNDSYIVKICTNIDNEENFKNEIAFYQANKGNNLIPKMYYANTKKDNDLYYYEILEKVTGVSLYNVWHTYSEKQREDIIKQLCDALKEIHSTKKESYDWIKFMKDKFWGLYKKVQELNVFNEDEKQLLEQAESYFDKYLKSDDFVLVHNDLHFDNIFVDNGKIKIIDFERSMIAPRDYDLDILYRMIRKPWKFASEETEQFTSRKQYSHIMEYIGKYYPALVSNPDLYKRLGIYDIVYYLNSLLEYPKLEELKEDVLNAAKIVVSKDI